MNERISNPIVDDAANHSPIGEALNPQSRIRPATPATQAPGFVQTLDADTVGGPSAEGPVFGGGGPTFNMNTFVENIRNALDGNCVGYAFAINQAGELARSGGGGSRQLANNPANNLPMGAKRRMHTASVTKNITATAVMKAMLDREVSTNARIRDFLPTQWDIHNSLTNLRIRDLLTHRTGFNTRASDPHYATLRDMIENATGWSQTIAASPYDNRNFALFRLILPYMVCPQVMANVEAEGWSNGNYDTAVDQATQDYYKILVRHYVFNPMGMRRMDCAPNPNNAKRTMCYMWPNPAPSQATDGGNKTDEAGSEGWVMSARQLAKYLRFRRYSTAFIPANTRQQMDDDLFGWRTIEGDHGAYLDHGGAYGGLSNGNCVPGSGPVRSQIMQFPINVEAAVTVNSFVTACSGALGLDQILRNAFDAAFI